MTDRATQITIHPYNHHLEMARSELRRRWRSLTIAAIYAVICLSVLGDGPLPARIRGHLARHRRGRPWPLADACTGHRHLVYCPEEPRLLTN